MNVGDYCRLIANDDYEAFVGQVSLKLDPIILGALLEEAASTNKVQYLEHLHALGLDLNLPGGLLDHSAMSSAAFEGSLDAAKFLHANGARIQLDSLDENPLFRAAGNGHLAFVKWLIDIGCDPHYTLKVGSKELNTYSLAVGEWPEVAEFLESLGCQLPENAIDQNLPQDVTDQTAPEVLNFMTEQFGPVDELSAQEIFAPLGAASVVVNFIQPNSNHRYLTVFSTGPSNQALTTPEGREEFQYSEFVMHLPADWPHPREADPKWQWPVSYFKQIAYYGLLRDTWLSDDGKIIVMAYEDDWPESADLSEVLLMPDMVPPLQADRLIRFYSIIPLTPQVHALGSEGGPPRIREAIQSGELDITSPWKTLLNGNMPAPELSNLQDSICDHFYEEISAVETFCVTEQDDSPTSICSVTVNFISPFSDFTGFALFSTGASTHTLNVPEEKQDFRFAEYVLHLPGDWPHPGKTEESAWTMEFFKQIAYFGHLNSTWGGEGDQIIEVDYDASWPQSTDLSRVLLLPDLVAPMDEEKLVRFYTIVPVTKEVKALREAGGVQNVVQAIESETLDLTAPWKAMM